VAEFHAAAAWTGRVRPEWFEVARYGANALPISDAGRGGAWYVEGPFGAGVLRFYRRGGWVARLSREHYLFTGTERLRCVRELRLLEDLLSLGLPVPEPIAGAWWREGPLYRAALLMRRLPARIDLMALVHADVAAVPWEDAGRCIAGFHRRGARHPDLNARNVLRCDDGRLAVIDWDRGRREGGPGRWCGVELDRLERSMLKHRRHVAEGAVREGMARLRAAHAEALR
jgi:3-deoxy-D-manno-octulosonic acid kinase